MNALEKIKRSWWVIFSAIILFNGLGFVYIGAVHNNRNWILEGVAYEIPWVFGIVFSSFDSIVSVYVAICMILMLVSIVRSVWVAIKLGDVYDNEDRYAVQTTVLNNPTVAKANSDFPIALACISCIVLVFIAYGLLVLL